ncbi:MAG TPA: nicotinate-nucleotide--dimethylbenzimidazole phosphoribosyltransferase [Acidimicrobiales bacterium]|nr:nicotinate-nucleotide--dimethylbenzimidazole phosphoribosyltransferase [Acidimicrobiales bacterium]
MTSLPDALALLVPTDDAAAEEADGRQVQLAKPPGSLGLLELLGSRLSAISGRCPPPVPERPVVVLAAGDHGVIAEGVSAWPVEVTGQMVASFLAGRGAVNVIASEVGASVVVVDVGVATDIPGPLDRLVKAKVRSGTANLVEEPAMSLDEARRAVQVGLSIGDRLVERGADLLVTGDMGVGNTTSAAALVAAITGWPARSVTGRGTGISDEMLERKTEAVEGGLERVSSASSVPVTGLGSLPADLLLAELGGLEIGALVGVCVAGAVRRVPVVVDGVVSLAAALVAVRLAPEVVGYLVPGHRSIEPGATAALDFMELDPLLDLHLGLGEGTGGCLAVPLVRTAARLLQEMATFADAGLSGVIGNDATAPSGSSSAGRTEVDPRARSGADEGAGAGSSAGEPLSDPLG